MHPPSFFTRRAPPPGRGALMSLLLLGLAGCQVGLQREPGGNRDYVPPVLLSAPEEPVRDVLRRDGGDILGSARLLRKELRRFADTVSTGARSYPAARCCSQVLRDLLIQGHRWDAGSRGEEGLVVPILEELVREPTLGRAPRLVERVLDRVTSPLQGSSTAPVHSAPTTGGGAPRS